MVLSMIRREGRARLLRQRFYCNGCWMHGTSMGERLSAEHSARSDDTVHRGPETTANCADVDWFLLAQNPHVEAALAAEESDGMDRNGFGGRAGSTI